MHDIDKKIKEKIELPKLPLDLADRVDETLADLPDKPNSEKTESQCPAKKRGHKRWFAKAAAVAVILLVVGLVGYSTTTEAAFTTFVDSLFALMHIDRGDAKDAGVSSKQTTVEQKSELFLEMKEVIVDAHNMYLRVQVTAPSDITLGKDISFDYFAFSKGENYNANALISGPRDCTYLESVSDKPNVAFYLMHISSSDKVEDGEMVTACFKDMVENPNSETPKMLVEGMWSLTFPADYTVTKEIREKYTVGEHPFPFMETTADLIKVDMTPLSCSVVMDVSNVEYEKMNVSDTSVHIALNLIDGTTHLLQSHDFEEKTYISSGSEEVSTLKNDRITLTKMFEFKNVIDLSKVVSIEIEDSVVRFSEE